MKKISIISLLLLLFICYFILYSGVNTNTAPSGRVISTSSKNEGSEKSSFHFIVAGMNGSPISKNFIDKFINHISPELKQKIFLKIVYLDRNVGSSFKDLILETVKNRDKSLLILAPDIILTKSSKDALVNSNINTVLYSIDDKIVCSNNSQLSNIWNFGLPLNAIAETYFSFLFQKYGKLAQELRVFSYINDIDYLENESIYIENTVKALGFKNVGKMKVDERIEDVYPSLRSIYDYNPKIIIGLLSRNGFYSFAPNILRLNLTFDIGLTFLDGVFEEDIFINSNYSKGILLPLQYVKQNQGELHTASMYQGYFLAEVLNKLNFRDNFSLLEFSKNIDGLQIHGPAGLVTIDANTHGLIHPLHVAEFRENEFKHVQYLGDVSMASSEMCK